MDNVNKLRAKFSRSKLLKLLFVASVICFIYIVYRFQNYDSFSTISKPYRTHTDSKLVSDGLLSVSNKRVDVMISLTKAEYNSELQNKFRTCIRSLFHFSSVHVNLHIIGDNASRDVATQILAESVEKSKYTVSRS